jgi:ABC-2 type transport system permease protein
MLDTTQAERKALTAPDRFIPSQQVTGLSKFVVDLKILWLEQMLEVRTSWYLFVIFSMVMPVAIVFGFARIGNGLSDRTSQLFIISGSAILTCTSDGIMGVALRVGSLKKEGTLVYYASLPISKTAFILAVIFSRLPLTLPGLLTPLLVGPLLNGAQLEFSLWVLLLIPLTGLTLSVIGMAIGSLLDSLELISIITNVLIFILLSAAPIFMPVAALPLPLQILSYFLPPSYAAEALRQALGGAIGPAFYLDLFVLLLMAGISFFVVGRWLSWRQK